MAIQPAGRGPELIGVYSFFLALTTITVFLRTYCRSLVVKNFALDDWFALLSWVRSLDTVMVFLDALT
jgi:hypothetical protein